MRKPAQEGRRRSTFARLVFSILAAIAMLATGGIVAAVHAPVAQAATNLSCAANVFYSVSGSGQITQITHNGDNKATLSTLDGGWSKVSAVNGLGIGANGAVAYAYERGGTATIVSPPVSGIQGGNKVATAWSGMNAASILRYTPANTWQTLTNTSYTTGLNMGLVTGAVDLATGKYLFGGFGTNSTYHSSGAPGQGGGAYYEGSTNDKMFFRLYSFDPANNSITTVGSFDIGKAAWELTGNNNNRKYELVSANGDMSFDSAGNLYIVRSGDTTQIYTITADTLAHANGGTLAFSKTDEKALSSLANVNGMAFDQDGTVYLGNGTTAKQYESQDWSLASNGNVTTGLSSSKDLASCQSPANIAVKKNVTARVNATDQFHLSLAQASVSIATEDTEGTATGVQPQQIGPVPALLNQAYVISESMLSGTASDYTSSYACVRKDTGATVASGSGTSGSVTIPNVASVSVECTFTNTPKPVEPGAVQWTKVDAANTNTKLGGSEWKITGPSGSSSSDIAVKDCTSGNCSGTNDVDPQAGQFKVQNLAPGKYTLTETKAPDGYALDSTPHDFTVTSGATASASTAPLTNKKLEQAVCRADSPNLYNQLSTPDGSQDHIGATANKIQRYDVTNGQTTDLADLQSLGVTRETNGLGISSNGRYFYVIDFNITSNPHIYQYDAQTGSVKTFNAANNGPNDNYKVRRGGVNLLNGIYYYSTTRQDSNGNPTAVNNLYAFDPAANNGQGVSWYVGAVNTRADAAGQSGDLAFDNQGNMYFVVGQNSSAYVYVYSGALPQTPNSQPISITPQYLNTVGDTGNGVGIAYGGGNLYISNTNGDFYRVDPSTGATTGMTGVGGNGNTVDLATCTSPNTLTVKKNYPSGRDNANDNVTLSAWRNTSTQVGQNVDTDGPATGVQTNQLGPVPILVGDGNSYSVRENAKGGSNSFAAYDTSYSCVDTNDSTWPEVKGTITSGDTQRDFTLGTISAGGAKARAIVCTFTNKPISGSVTWSKSGPDGTTLLSGSEWTLTGPGAPANTVVKDCTSTPCSTQPYTDQDPARGAFRLDSLKFGAYTLTESTAPAGYIKVTTPRPFTIDATHREIKLGVFKNPQQTPPTLPLTGGMSTDAFVIGGSALMVVSAGVWLALRRRSRAEA
jgi:LPXTG-motif cell wall-anchored protein